MIRFVVLRKASYGLKQSSRKWYQRLDSFLRKLGFLNSESDPCVYNVKGKVFGDSIFILVYADDLIIASKHKTSIESVKSALAKEFSMTELDELNYHLGIDVERKYGNIYISQKLYLQKVLQLYNMAECNGTLRCFLSLIFVT